MYVFLTWKYDHCLEVGSLVYKVKFLDKEEVPWCIRLGA